MLQPGLNDDAAALNRRVERWPIGFHMALLFEATGSALAVIHLDLALVGRPGRC